MEEFDNYQFTLTFKKEVNKKEADKEIARWLRPLTHEIDERTIELRIVSEIGRNLKYHFHGYFCWFRGHPVEQRVKHMLFKWKHSIGFTAISHGDISSWNNYISKDSGPKHLVDINEENANEWIKEQLMIIKDEQPDWLDYIGPTLGWSLSDDETILLNSPTMTKFVPGAGSQNGESSGTVALMSEPTS